MSHFLLSKRYIIERGKADEKTNIHTAYLLLCYHNFHHSLCSRTKAY